MVWYGMAWYGMVWWQGFVQGFSSRQAGWLTYRFSLLYKGGHTKAASYLSFPKHAASHGTAVAAQIARLELANIWAMHKFARDNNIACDAVECGTVDVHYDAGGWEEAVRAVEEMQKVLGKGDPAGEYELYSREEVLERFHVGDGVFRGKEEKVCGGVGYAAGSISAYKFTVGMLKMCLAWGMNLQTGTAVLGLAGDGQLGWTVITERGVVRAGSVVLATNGYTAALAPEFQEVIMPFRGQISAQRPGKNLPDGGCLPTTYSFIYEGGGYEYMVPRPKGTRYEGDIIMGGGLLRASSENGLEEFGTTDDTTLNTTIREYLAEASPRYFGSNWGEDDPAGRVRKEWTGIMGHSADGLPLVGEVPLRSGLWASCSFQGNGMALCWMCGKALVAIMDDQEDENRLDSWFPSVFRISDERMAKRFDPSPLGHRQQEKETSADRGAG